MTSAKCLSLKVMLSRMVLLSAGSRCLTPLSERKQTKNFSFHCKTRKTSMTTYSDLLRKILMADHNTELRDLDSSMWNQLRNIHTIRDCNTWLLQHFRLETQEILEI